MAPVKIVSCPTCRKSVAWEVASRWRPFCSERCKMVDLHGWFAEQHVIPGDPLGEPLGEDRSSNSVDGARADGGSPSDDEPIFL